MDGQQPAQARANLIRPEQVAKLPHLTPEQKVEVHKKVERLWQFINANSNNPADPKIQQAYQTLTQLSGQLMQGMKQFNQQRMQRAQLQQQQQQQAQIQQANQQVKPQVPIPQVSQPIPAQPGQAGGPQSSTATFNALPQEVKNHVNTLAFVYPPAMQEGTDQAQIWLQEAKARYGQAVQRGQLAKNKRAELQKAAQGRTAAGRPLEEKEQVGLEQKLGQCEKALRESQTFIEKFREQQAQFTTQRQQQSMNKFSQNTGQADGMDGRGTANGPAPTQMAGGGGGGPTAHSIATAQAAARAQAGNANSIQTPTQVQSSAPLDNQPVVGTQAMPQANPSRPQTAVPQSATQMQQPMPTHAQAQAVAQQTTHAHPINAVQQNPVSSATSRNTAISKSLQIAEPVPVPMPASRPTLNGGAGVGLPGQLQQPALQALPGYVLESSEDGHLLSKKKLQELVREVLGPHSEDMLSTEAEEICLSLIDDFIDDLLVASCRLAKLRGSTTLEARDIQVILERQYNMRIPGFSTDEIRTVRKQGPTTGWLQKMSQVAASKFIAGTSGNRAHDNQ